ncbi:MAG: DUF748 domain-containing protein [Planctomycetes bacterium]|nr:DUF748 domain-containing protein [Planctomycetota bacterium]
MPFLALRILAVPVIVLLAMRTIAPDLVERHLERSLSASGTYRASIRNVDLHLWRMAYRIKDLDLVTLAEGEELPFIHAPRTDVTLVWSDLLRGEVRARAVIEQPTIDVVVAKAAPENAKETEERTKEVKDSAEKGEKPGVDGLEIATGTELGEVIAPAGDWRTALREMMPTTIERLEICRGTLRYVDLANGLEVPLERLELVATNLTNRPVEGEPLPTSIALTADTIGGATLDVDGRIDLLAPQPTFTVSASLEKLHLPAINELLRSYVDFDLEDGDLDLYVDADAGDGALDGMVKPLVTNLNVVDAKEIKKDGVIQSVKEAVIGAAAEVTENQGKDRQATEIPISGDFNDPKTDPMTVIKSALGNAFVQAIKPGHERSERKRDDGKDTKRRKQQDREGKKS